MSEPRVPGDLPPDLPPEYAEAYRRGYKRAYLEASGRVDTGETTQVVEPEPLVVEPEGAARTSPPQEPPVETTDERPSLFADLLWEDDDAEPTEVLHLPRPAEEPTPRHAWAPEPEARPEAEPAPAGPWAADVFQQDVFDQDYTEEHSERPGWFVPALLAGLVLVLVVAAFGIGRLLSSSVGGADVEAEEPTDGVVLGESGAASDTPGGDQPQQRPNEDAYQGAVEAAPIGGASASCQAPSSVDAAGNEIAYPPTGTYDGDMTTAWRCNGNGVGQTLTVTLPETVRIGEVGLVPGYAKTDPRNGVDRYAENNRLTRVRWTFSDGTSVVQRLDGAPTNRAMQTMRIEPTDSNSVVVEVLASTPGPRNTIAVSEITVGRAVE